MKTLWGKLKLGFIALIPILVIVAVLVSVVNWITNIGYSFVGNQSINIAINLAILFVGLPFLCGCMLSMRWFRNLGLSLLGKLPLVGPLFGFILNHDYVERIQSGELKEVMFKHAGVAWAIGGVVNEFEWPESGDPKIAGPLVKWCIVLGPPTAPLAFTAHVLLIKKTDLVFTGRSYKDTILTTASFGFNFDIKRETERYRKEYRSPAQGS
ncbi:MAG: hypothetical protein G01um10143_839 [Parcubacteria group bacterium Gr01-1014_3]|nr:MAG: hypothetical protein G01um10143_839 [Parcubacteria group bacterium Gr01-1014_3]